MCWWLNFNSESWITLSVRYARLFFSTMCIWHETCIFTPSCLPTLTLSGLQQHGWISQLQWSSYCSGYCVSASVFACKHLFSVWLRFVCQNKIEIFMRALHCLKSFKSKPPTIPHSNVSKGNSYWCKALLQGKELREYIFLHCYYFHFGILNAEKCHSRWHAPWRQNSLKQKGSHEWALTIDCVFWRSCLPKYTHDPGRPCFICSVSL